METKSAERIHTLKSNTSTNELININSNAFLCLGPVYELSRWLETSPRRSEVHKEQEFSFRILHVVLTRVGHRCKVLLLCECLTFLFILCPVQKPERVWSVLQWGREDGRAGGELMRRVESRKWKDERIFRFWQLPHGHWSLQSTVGKQRRCNVCLPILVNVSLFYTNSKQLLWVTCQIYQNI